MSTLSFFLAILSGSFNGAYTYHLKSSENKSLSWIIFGTITFLFIPLSLLIASITTHNIYLNQSSIMICLLVGILFGLGMYLFSLSVKYIGIGIPFALNISLGTISGGLFSLLIHHNYQLINLPLITAYINFILAIIICSISLSLRERNDNSKYIRGLVYALSSGLLCSFQGATISFFSDEILLTSHNLLALILPWLLIFISCSAVFILPHFIEYNKQKPILNNGLNPITFFSGIMMSTFYILSIIIYNLANTYTNSFSSEYMWILFMSTIIISSCCVSHLNHEWKNKSKTSTLINFLSLGLIIISIVLLGIASLR
ncbi:hypothetical protein L3V82_11950 [Thiotrichales bacterium 19S3-7]|nr:hypothetical protein [Thiotrichales bacterium 19S3-7]MCF6802807.1 hypothetical protein [Thiotrichales bacterium 19S3-11]